MEVGNNQGVAIYISPRRAEIEVILACVGSSAQNAKHKTQPHLGKHFVMKFKKSTDF